MKLIPHIALPAILYLILGTSPSIAASPDSSFRSSLPVLNIRDDTIDLIQHYPGRDIFIIFYNHYSCRDCFATLASTVRNLHADVSAPAVTVLIRSEKGAYARRSALTSAKKALPDVTDFYFDSKETSAEDPWPPENLRGGLFGRYNASKTPSLLWYSRDGVTRYLSYEDLAAPLALPASRRAEALREFLEQRLLKKEQKYSGKKKSAG